MANTMKSSPKNSSRESEIALLDQLSTQLDNRTGRTGLPTYPRPATQLQKARLKSFDSKSKNVSTNILMVKTLVKGIVNACLQEEVTIATSGKQFDVLGGIVEEYRCKYPSLTRRMITDVIARQKKSLDKTSEKSGIDKSDGDGQSDDGEGGIVTPELDNGNVDLKIQRCIEIIEAHLEEYHGKIDALKRSRESALATEPFKALKSTTPSKKRKSTGEDESVKRPRGRPKSHTPETALVDEITDRYLKERSKLVRLPHGRFKEIVEEAKKDYGMQAFDVTLIRIKKRVTYHQMKRKDRIEKEAPLLTKKKEIIEKAYERYERTRIANKGMLAPGTLKSIIEGAKLELGMGGVKMQQCVEVLVQNRFRRNHPKLSKRKNLSEHDKQRRQSLVNEIAARCARAAEENPKKELHDYELECIIAQTADVLGMHEFSVSKACIRSHASKKAAATKASDVAIAQVDQLPFDAIDEPLLKTINDWLSQGISVTRAQGIEVANTLLQSQKEKHPVDETRFILDANWWRRFLERNKDKLACSSSDGI